MTKTCENCVHAAEYKCSHPEGNSRPTYSNGKESIIYSPACDLHEAKAESDDVDQIGLVYEHNTIVALTGKSDEEMRPTLTRFNNDIAEALSQGWQPSTYTTCLDGGQVMFTQTMVRRVR